MRILSCIFAVALSTSASAQVQQDTVRLTSNISKVTVFFSGAQVSRQAALKLLKGKTIAVIEHLPWEVEASSIQVAVPEHCVIQSVKLLPQGASSATKSKAQLALEKDIEARKRDIKLVKSEIAVYDIEERLMLDNSRFGGKEGVSAVEEIRAAADLYRSRINEIRRARLTLEAKVEEANKGLLEAFNALNELSSEHQRAYSQIIVSLDCSQPVNGSLNLGYYVPSAGWEPLYDFRVSDIKSPLALVYNANIFQSTGEDWKEVMLTLSTSNPQLTGEKPSMEPWLISYRRRVAPQVLDAGSGEVRGKVTDAESGEPLPFVNMALMVGGQRIAGATTDFDGNYVIKPVKAGSCDIMITYLGYEPAKVQNVAVSNNRITFQNIQMNASGVKLAQYEVVEYAVPLISKDGGASGGTVRREDVRPMPARNSKLASGAYDPRLNKSESTDYYIDGIRMRGAREESQYIHYNLHQMESEDLIANSLITNVTHLEYAIEVPFTVKSDGQDYQIKIKEAKVPVDYVYHVVPKLDPDAFLSANVVNWADLNLISGSAGIYFKGTYTGSTWVDAAQTSDTLTLSLGRDKSIVVQRKGNRELNDKRTIGNNVRETQAWDLVVRNNRNEAVKIVLYDQYPVSELKSVQVNLLQHQGAKVTDKTGELRWELELAQSERREITFLYEVRYPSGSAALLK